MTADAIRDVVLSLLGQQSNVDLTKVSQPLLNTLVEKIQKELKAIGVSGVPTEAQVQGLIERNQCVQRCWNNMRLTSGYCRPVTA